MEGAGIVREERPLGRPEATGRPSPVRLAAGIAVLVLLALIAVLLIPPYYHDWQFHGFLEALAHDSAGANRPPDLIRALVVDRAASMGLPVRTGDVHVTAGRNGPRIEVLYVVHVDLPVYTVDLHFRPTA